MQVGLEFSALTPARLVDCWSRNCPTATKARLSTFLPSQASLSNPVDMIASAGPDHYRQTIETLLSCDEIDALVVIYIPVDASQRPAILDAIRAGIEAGRQAGGVGKPVLASLMVEEGSSLPLQLAQEAFRHTPFRRRRPVS